MSKLHGMIGISDPAQTRKFFELFSFTSVLAELEGLPLKEAMRLHEQARQELADFMLKFADFGDMTWCKFDRSGELSKFLVDNQLDLDRQLSTLSGQLWDVYYSGELVGYCHTDVDNFMIGVKISATSPEV